MNSTFKIFLKANERLFINGAVFRVDRKVAVELLNDVHFLLEQHVLQLEDANTPLRQLYFVVQMMVISPNERESVMPVFDDNVNNLLAAFQNKKVVSDVKQVHLLVHEGRFYEALKTIRGLYDLEKKIMDGDKQHETPELKVAV